MLRILICPMGKPTAFPGLFVSPLLPVTTSTSTKQGLVQLTNICPMECPNLHWEVFGACKLQKLQRVAGSVVWYYDCRTNAVL